MPSFELALFALVGLLAALGGVGLWIALRSGGPSRAQEALAAGRFEDAAGLAEPGDEGATLAAAIAARHLLRWNDAERLLRRLVEEDPLHGEALLELGLLELLRGRPREAMRRWEAAAQHRADLLESIQLHRALAAILAGDVVTARLLFEEIEAPLETKLRVDVGEGDPVFAEWFLHAALVWHALGRDEKAAWAYCAALRAAPESRLPDLLARERSLWPDAPREPA